MAPNTDDVIGVELDFTVVAGRGLVAMDGGMFPNPWIGRSGVTLYVLRCGLSIRGLVLRAKRISSPGRCSSRFLGSAYSKRPSRTARLTAETLRLRITAAFFG